MTHIGRATPALAILLVGVTLFSATSLSAAKFNTAVKVNTAAKFNKVLDIGQPAPAWNDLLGVDNKRHGLSDLKEAKLVVVIFACNH